MPVKIKHKHDGEIKTVAYVNWISQYNHVLWDVIELWDVGKIYNIQGKIPVYQSTVDRQDFLDAIQHPVNKNALDFEPLPDIRQSKESDFAERATAIDKTGNSLKTITKIKTNRLERKFLKFLDQKTTAFASEIDIEQFMVSNFDKPNPRSAKTINSTDKGVVFLKNLKAKCLIDFDDKALDHVNNWTIDTEGKIKRWFDSLHEPLYVSLQISLSESLPLSERLLNRKFVLYKTKYAIINGIKYLIKFIVSVWKFMLLVAAGFLANYLAEDHNFLHLINWVKSILDKNST